jgi:HAD superfamily phosphatase (TIGR01668 family)
VFLKPDYLIDGDITDIDLEELERAGIKGLILDLDSTLIAPKSAFISDQASAWLERARKKFVVAVASNNKNELYLDKVREMLNIRIIGKARKPSRKAFKRLLEEFDLTAQQIAVVGDRPLTDIWGGQRAGMKTILVRILRTMNEPKWKTKMRNLERVFIRHD